MRQLSLFPTTIKSVYLEADSPKKAFYAIKIVENMGSYSIVKKSGCNGKVMHSQSWVANSYSEAIKFFEKKLREKTKKGRKRTYTYRRVKNG